MRVINRSSKRKKRNGDEPRAEDRAPLDPASFDPRRPQLLISNLGTHESTAFIFTRGFLPSAAKSPISLSVSLSLKLQHLLIERVR